MNKQIVSTRILNDCKITTFDDGSEWIEPIEQPKQTIVVDDKSWWQRLKDWWNDSPVTPYIKVKDLADPFGDRANDIEDIDVGSDGKPAVEVSIKIKF